MSYFCTMTPELRLYNRLTKKEEVFSPLNPPYVGMYVCGPTVYGDPHLGHARSAVTFDLLFRYLKFLGYKVRYVRNITDVGHLEHDADEGEDKIIKQARAVQLEPMEVAHFYTLRYREAMKALNTLPPSIEPTATGHIIEQIEFIRCILAKGFAYEVNGSVYFDLKTYAQSYPYGILSGREAIEEMIAGSRALQGQGEKRYFGDFALWKRAPRTHLMRWPSPWGEGFPGWHIECTVMSTKYLGNPFDIHGGGLDLTFPHHEAEIAQANAYSHPHPTNQARFWIHNNLITINGQKMSKSLGNFITLEALFTGTHALLPRAFSPIVLRFLFLQSHYRKPLDFSVASLEAAEQALKRLLHGYHALKDLPVTPHSSINVSEWKQQALSHLNDDLNTPALLSLFFTTIHEIHAGTLLLSPEDKETMIQFWHTLLFEILGLQEEVKKESTILPHLIDLILELRQQFRNEKKYGIADAIRNRLNSLGIEVLDKKEKSEWQWK
jgi:cysteinyl-tRNA synthetase